MGLVGGSQEGIRMIESSNKIYELGHGAKCNYCGGNYACNCEWPDGEHMCPRCDFDSEELKRLGTCHGYGSSSRLIRTLEE